MIGVIVYLAWRRWLTPKRIVVDWTVDWRFSCQPGTTATISWRSLNHVDLEQERTC